MTDETRKKVTILEKFLKSNKIEFSKIEPTTSTTLRLKKNIYITNRSGFTKGYEDLGINSFIFAKIRDMIVDINFSVQSDDYVTEIDKLKMHSLLTKIDRTLKGDEINIHFEPSDTFGGATASRKKIILFDPPRERIEEHLKIVPGINYHELGHVLYTCSFARLAPKLKQKYIEYEPLSANYSEKEWKYLTNCLLRVVNIFEDGRVENLMGNRYGLSISYFKGTIYNFLMTSLQEKIDMEKELHETDCVLIAGRKYLDPKIRRWIFEKYMELDPVKHTIEKARRVNSYINKYITLSWQTDKEEMIDLCMGFFFEFLKEDMEKQMQNVMEWNKLLDKLLKNMETSLAQISGDSDGDIDESEQAILNKVKKELGTEIKIGDKPDEKGDEPGGEKAGKSEKDFSDDKVRQLIQDDKKKAEDQVADQTKTLKRKLKSTEIKNSNNKQYDDKPITDLMKKEEAELERKLKLFTQKCRNGYLSRKRKGCVDIGEARRQEYRGGMKIFRQYRHNVRKEIDIDVAFILDCSSSMASGGTKSKIDAVSQQLWIASTACKAVGAKMKMFTFSDNYLGTIDPPTKKTVYRVPKYRGGTTIADTLYIAENYLDCSKANNKWTIVLTDGEIGDQWLQKNIIERMKNNNVTCGKINLGMGSYGSYKKSEEYDHVLWLDYNNDTITSQNNEDIVSFFKKIYEIGMEKTGRKF